MPEEWAAPLPTILLLAGIGTCYRYLAADAAGAPDFVVIDVGVYV